MSTTVKTTKASTKYTQNLQRTHAVASAERDMAPDLQKARKEMPQMAPSAEAPNAALSAEVPNAAFGNREDFPKGRISVYLCSKMDLPTLLLAVNRPEAARNLENTQKDLARGASEASKTDPKDAHLGIICITMEL